MSASRFAPLLEVVAEHQRRLERSQMQLRLAIDAVTRLHQQRIDEADRLLEQALIDAGFAPIAVAPTEALPVQEGAQTEGEADGSDSVLGDRDSDEPGTDLSDGLLRDVGASDPAEGKGSAADPDGLAPGADEPGDTPTADLEPEASAEPAASAIDESVHPVQPWPQDDAPEGPAVTPALERPCPGLPEDPDGCPKQGTIQKSGHCNSCHSRKNRAIRLAREGTAPGLCTGLPDDPDGCPDKAPGQLDGLCPRCRMRKARQRRHSAGGDAPTADVSQEPIAAPAPTPKVIEADTNWRLRVMNRQITRNELLAACRSRMAQRENFRLVVSEDGATTIGVGTTPQLGDLVVIEVELHLSGWFCYLPRSNSHPMASQVFPLLQPLLESGKGAGQ